MKKTIIALTIMVALITFVAVFPGPAMAKVTGTCVNCHTMHNSQGGSEMATGEPNATLLMNSCMGCHTGTNTGGTTPFVMDTSEPTFGTNTLAGGNFWWVENVNDKKGHNVVAANSDDDLTVAPGISNGEACGSNSCHENLNTAPSAMSGKNSCQSCHLEPAHHTVSSGNVTAAPWFRWLSGHMGGNGLGVKGIEHAGWSYGATAGGTNHSEYLGNVATKTSAGGFAACGSTMTGFCTGCHGEFHKENTEDDGSGNWTRHPADVVIPDTEGSEYKSMSTSYNPNTPVARPASGGITWTNAVGVATVAAGTDMVMCLSCHVAHGSPYDDMLRWDYADMIAGDDSKSGGCFVCHTTKND